ncbi:Non-ous end-joining factor 1 [Balamuthia mandrillaris]
MEAAQTPPRVPGREVGLGAHAAGDILKELEAEPWQRLVLPTTGRAVGASSVVTTLFFKAKFLSTAYVLLATDLTAVWAQCSQREDIKRDKELFNPLLEMPVKRLLLLLKQYLLQQEAPDPPSALESTQFEAQREADGSLQLLFSRKIDFYCLKWAFRCHTLFQASDPAQALFFKRYFTLPLLFVADELQQQVADLKATIMRKEAEIEEYKSRGAVLPKAFTTPRFDHDKYDEDRLQTFVACSISQQPPSHGLCTRLYQSFLELQPPHDSNNPPPIIVEEPSQSPSAANNRPSNKRSCPSKTAPEDTNLFATPGSPSKLSSTSRSLSVPSSSSSSSASSSSAASPPRRASPTTSPARTPTRRRQLVRGYEESPEEARRRAAIQHKLAKQLQKKSSRVCKKPKFV